MAIEPDKALLCARKLRRVLSFFEAPKEFDWRSQIVPSSIVTTTILLCSFSGLFDIF